VRRTENAPTARVLGVPAWILATAGCDGPSGTGGAVIDGDTAAPGLDAAISAHDTGSWLTAAGCALPEGPTGTQVGDLWVVLVGAPPPSADAAP
jgi:glycerate-2-kinase